MTSTHHTWCLSCGMVEIVMPTIETATKLVLRMLTYLTFVFRIHPLKLYNYNHLAAKLVSGFSMRSHISFWYWANFPGPKSSSSSFLSFPLVSSISSTTPSLLVKYFSLKCKTRQYKYLYFRYCCIVNYLLNMHLLLHRIHSPATWLYVGVIHHPILQVVSMKHFYSFL